ncbi:unnamed protein product [Strongylus vulgaris]|uniref:Peptidase A1 domain-containing protein n=1 Tax=Strongylus vulgaris TaxID=40348 RepID=A0A3P7ISV0_STRVU|nr:unnamed protein product [Strongylus vulgaris]
MGDYKVMDRTRAEQDLYSLMVLPTAVADKMAKIANARPDRSMGIYFVDCNAKFPAIEIEAGLDTYTIRTSDLIIKIFLSMMDQDGLLLAVQL